MNSLPTIVDYKAETENNEKQFLDMLSRVDPELYIIKMSLMETKLNPRIIPRFIRALSNLAIGTGYGVVRVFMQQRLITQVKGEESDNLNLPVEGGE